ncbi:hypothetical protein HPP92_027882 [Vanilla planifolia]|uniref:Uncharacterized protein n=1 Tax=Vanilla planifolia TaxID=51239 RepID=A0A835U4U5_VANPL|nr:hypothetical protein HPP92_027882 [Vanilla planifolia]
MIPKTPAATGGRRTTCGGRQFSHLRPFFLLRISKKKMAMLTLEEEERGQDGCVGFGDG